VARPLGRVEAPPLGTNLEEGVLHELALGQISDRNDRR
jgi:hypothetical protein